jgi:translocation and assembly module TamB
VFDRLQIATDQQYLINTKPVEFTLGEGVDLLELDWGKNELTLKPFEFHVNDGILTGYLTLTDEVDGLLKISNIGSDILDFLIPDEWIKIQGQVFGELSVTSREYSLDYSIDVAIKNGEIASQPFDELIISTFYRDSILHIDEITLIHGDKTGIQIAGVVPQYYGESNPIEIDAMINMKKVDISIFTQFIPDWFALDGVVSGMLNFNGLPNKTKFNFNLSIDDCVFEGLELGHVTGMGLYDSERLYFNQFSSIRGKDHAIAGAAYLPLDLNFNSENLGEMILADSMWVDVSGDFNHLEFLSEYLIDVDSLPGNHNISLQIAGPPDKLLRNGKISIKDGSIYTILLDEPIKGVNGKGILVNNMLSIENLVGSATIKPENNKANIFIGGNINMTKFFEPYYDLSAKGSDVFFKTLLGDIEGMVNIDVRITGRDTITIAGGIEAIDAVMYQEFEVNTLPTAELDPSNTIINYKLNFPITGKFVLRNSQIDAQLGGELSISMFGDQSADYTGELFVREGKFYYYGDIFSITNGYLAFDTKGFNPYLDLSAFTKIKEENITITLVGPLDNPKLGLESSSGFSESDILELLTIRSRFEDQEISSSGLGSKAQSIFVAYLEKELERNFMQISGLGRLGIVEDVSISGASALIDPTVSDDLVIKAQVSRNLSLNYSYIRSFSFANPYLNQVGVELKLNPYFSLIGNVDELGNMHVKYRLRYSY